MLPFTILAGYLGAGKTTRIIRLLTRPQGERVGVLVNDFGSINIDHALVAEHGGDSIALSNGCVCCTIADNLAGALDNMLTRSQNLDRLVLEASGTADPSRLRGYAETWPGLRSLGVVTVADVRRVRALCDDKYVGATVRRQLRHADRIVLSHTDAITGERVDSLVPWIKTQTAAAITVDTAHGVDWVSGKATDPRAPSSGPVPAPAGHYSTTVASRDPLSRRIISALLRSPPSWILRAKGWLYRDDQPGTPYLLQGVPGDWSLKPLPFSPPAGGQTAVVVVWADRDKGSREVHRLFGISDDTGHKVAPLTKQT